jgi:hypothetical protein
VLEKKILRVRVVEPPWEERKSRRSGRLGSDLAAAKIKIWGNATPDIPRGHLASSGDSRHPISSILIPSLSLSLFFLFYLISRLTLSLSVVLLIYIFSSFLPSS